MEELNVRADVDNIQVVTDFVDSRLRALNYPQRILTQINIAIDELFGNIARYAFTSRKGPDTVRAEVKANPSSVILTFIDRGMPFDPLAIQPPDTTLPARERKIGGLGIFMVKKSMDNITYEYKDGMNILTIHKNMPSAE